MANKKRNIIIALIIGVLIGSISLNPDQISVEAAPWESVLIFILANTLVVPLFVFFLNALPDFVKLKYIFTVKYFYYVSIFIMGVGLGAMPFLVIANKDIASSIHFLLFGMSLFVSSMIANKLFGGLE